MDINVLLLADYANVTQNGKLNVMGVFDNINASGGGPRVSYFRLCRPGSAGEQ